MGIHIKKGTCNSSQGTYQLLSLSQLVSKPRHLIQGSERMKVLLLLQLYSVSNDNTIHQGGITVNSSQACLGLYAQRLSGTCGLFSTSQRVICQLFICILTSGSSSETQQTMKCRVVIRNSSFKKCSF